jgi:hypothetical protein
MSSKGVHQHCGTEALYVIQAQDQLRVIRYHLVEPGLVADDLGPLGGLAQLEGQVTGCPDEAEVSAPLRKALDVLKAEGAILTSPMGTFIA